MLFNESPKNIKESYKERNLYYKIFAGCLFNELIPGLEIRADAFLNLIKDKNKIGEKAKAPYIDMLHKMKNEVLHVDFDHHLCQIALDNDEQNCRAINGGQIDKGEFADVLIYSDTGMIAIEVKYKSNWTIDKDIIANRKRIKFISDNTKKSAMQVLLISNNKYKNSQKRGDSQLNLLKTMIANGEIVNLDSIGLAIISWEDIQEIFNEERFGKVSEYLSRQLKDI